VLVAGWTFSAYGPHWIDDSYITFRFAQKLAEGKGLAYNAGERTLGFSAPLYTLILGATTALGLPILPTSLALGMLGVAGALALLVALGRVAGNELAGWAAAFLTITQFFWVIFFVSGMETMLVCAVTLGLLGAASAGRWKLIGPLAGILCWLRYDGALGAAVALGWMAWRAGRRTAGREVLKAAAVYLPWFLFSWAYFGSPIPQTIRAKSLINYTAWSDLPSHYLAILQFQPFWGIWLAVAALGWIVTARRMPGFGVIPLWLAIYAAAFVFMRVPVSYYPWYLVPLIPGGFLGAALGWSEVIRAVLCRLGRVRPRWRITGYHADTVFLCLSAFLVLTQIMTLLLHEPAYGKGAMNRERAYRRTAEALESLMQPGQSVYVGETGALGYHLPKAWILDSAGLISPEIHAIRVRDREALRRQGVPPSRWPDGSPEVTRMVLRELRPDFITTKKIYLHIEEIRTEAEFNEHYEELTSPLFGEMDQCAFRRKYSPR
jgi:hypothetical protein